MREEVASVLASETAELPSSSVARMSRVTALSARGGIRALAKLLPPVVGQGRAHQKGVEKLAASLGELKGVPMKIGQFLSYGSRALPDATRSGLSALLTHAQPLPFEKMRAVVAAELGPAADAILARMDPQPIGIGSIGQVHKTQLPDGTLAAVKIQFPGIAEAIATDCTPAAIGAHVASWLNPGSRREAFVEEARRLLLEECDYEREAATQIAFAEQFAGHPVIWVPPVYLGYSSRRVLTSVYVEGLDLERYLGLQPSAEERDRAGTALFDFYFGSLFTLGRYNRDPHFGNYLFCPGGRIAFVDHGSARVFEPDFVVALSELTLAVASNDDAWMHESLLATGFVPAGQPYDHALARRLLSWFYGPVVQDELAAFGSARELVPELSKHRRELRRLDIPGELLFLLRMRVGLAAVLEKLGARANWWRLQRQYFERSITRLVEHEVVLMEAGPRAIEVIREVRHVSNLSVKEAKALVDAAPQVVARALHRREAEAFVARMEALGSRMEIRRSGHG